MNDEELNWLDHKDRKWLKEGPERDLNGNLTASNDKISNELLEDFRENHKDDITQNDEFLAIHGTMKDGKLMGKYREINLKEPTSTFYSRPGLYIIKQNPAQEFDRLPKRTHYVGEAKNLAKRLNDRENDRTELFLEGSKITIIIKYKGKIEDDQFFIHEVRTTAERMICDFLEDKGFHCRHKANWCFVHNAGLDQIRRLEKFVLQLCDNTKISFP